MVQNAVETDYADASRAPDGEIRSDASFLDKVPMIHSFVDLVPDVFLVLNQERQIVYSNRTLLHILGIKNPDSIYGLRPGEAINCIHAGEKTGCGTSVFCRYCGAVNAILGSQRQHDETVVDECRIMTADNTALDFRVWAKTINLDNKDFTMFVIRDISNEKRRQVLERTFFHDILNTAGGIQGVMGILHTASQDELDELISMVETASETLIEEIKAQKDLLAAESGELHLHIRTLNSVGILADVRDVYFKHEVAEGKNIVISADSEELEFQSDSGVLKRILSNMLKNALEATLPGGTVSMEVVSGGDGLEFSVHNDAVMSEEVKMQLFQRSFSTKGAGRGIGTYSIKMLTEKYLGGKVFFSSEPEEGTTVRVTVPDKTEIKGK